MLRRKLLIRCKFNYDVTTRNCHSGPLSGIRILDFTRILAGPFATMILGDLGAEIIKVEKPGTGDDTRTWGPPFVGKESCYFLSVNRNKKSIVVDLKRKQGVQIVKKLLQNCDVLVENFKPGTMEQLGLGYDVLKAVSPGLIYASITGFGDEGPYKDRAGLDVLAASIGGLMGVTGPKNGEPCKVGVAMTDLTTGLYLHGSILAALLEKQRTSKGQKISCDLLSTQVSCMVNLASNYLNSGQLSPRRGTEHESIVPYQSFKTKDGYLTIGVANEKHFKNLCQILNLDDVSNDNRFQSNALRVKNREILIKILNDKFKENSNKYWMEKLKTASFAYGPINDLKETFEDPQIIHNEIVKEIPHFTEGEIKVVGPPVKYSISENRVRSSPPVLGQHTEEILVNIAGISPKEVERLKDEGIIETYICKF